MNNAAPAEIRFDTFTYPADFGSLDHYTQARLIALGVRWQTRNAAARCDRARAECAKP